MNNDRYYQKGNPEKDLLKSVARETQPAALDNATNRTAPVSSYTKPDPKYFPKKWFVVYSGGEVRERNYFHLITYNPSLYPDIKIEFIPEPRFEEGGKPAIMKVAVEKTQKYKKSANNENPDKFFLLTDVDNFKNFLLEMMQECNANDIELIISNPCFEVWLYYSKKDDKCISYDYQNKNEKISSGFKTWVNTQIPGGINPANALLDIEQNIENAKKNYSDDDDRIPSLFSTQMFKLAEQLLPYVLKGNSKIITKRASAQQRTR